MHRKQTTKMEHALLAIAILVTIPVTVSAQEQPWTTVGSAGTVDELDLSMFSFVNGEAQFLSTVASGTLNIRYNIVALDDLVESLFFDFIVRARDNGASAQVRVHLKRYSLETGTTSTLATWDSNSFSSASAYQTNEVLCIAPGFDFENNAYFMDAELIKTGATGTPALGIVQLRENANCLP